jgi:hypothetical protein
MADEPVEKTSRELILGKRRNMETMAEATERHYRIREISQLWGISAEKVRRLFQDVDGVLKLGDQGQGILAKRKKRPYVTLLVPESVLQRFHQQWSAGFGVEVQRRRG